MFTIIVPTHERPILLRRTLQSLIAQTYKDFKVIVVDDSSRYVPPYEELNALGGRHTYIIRSGNRGPAASRNMGLRLLDDDYVIFLDDDDTFEPGHLEALAEAIGDARPPLVFCDFQVQHEDRDVMPPRLMQREMISIAGVTRDSVYVLNRIPNSCLAYRRDVVQGLNFPGDMDLYEDWDFLLQCVEQHDLVHVNAASVVIHKSQPTSEENLRRGNSQDEKLLACTLQLYRKYTAPNTLVEQARRDLLTSAGYAASY